MAFINGKEIIFSPHIHSSASGTKNITANGTHDVESYKYAAVNVPQPSGSVNITANGTYDVTDKASAVVNVPSQEPTLQSKTLTIGSSAPSTVSPDSGYDGLSSVAVSLDTTVFKAENIKEGVTLAGITGSLSSLTQLSAPTISLATETVSWSAVTNAVVYGVYADSTNIGYTMNVSENIKTMIQNNALPSGTYTITVKAIGDGVNYGTSNASNFVSYTYSAIPTDLTNTSWRFTKISGITGIEQSKFSVNGIIFEGSYSISVTHQLTFEIYHDAYYIVRDSWNSNPRFMAVNSRISYYTSTDHFIDGFTLTITGGSDATNTTLINWLFANTQQVVS